MATPTASPVPAAESNPLIDVFFSPAAAMDSLARKPRFVLPLIIITAIGIATMVVAFQRGVVDHFMRQQLEPRLERLTPEQREQAMERMLRFAPYQMVGGATLSPTIGALVISGIFLLIAYLMGGGGASFKQMLAVVTHSCLPLSVSGLIGIPILLAKEPDAVDLRNIVMANPSFLFDPTEQHKLYMVASSFDLFSFWVIALMTIGISRLTGKSKGTALVVVLIPWALYVAIGKAWLG